MPKLSTKTESEIESGKSCIVFVAVAFHKIYIMCVNTGKMTVISYLHV